MLIKQTDEILIKKNNVVLTCRERYFMENR